MTGDSDLQMDRQEAQAIRDRLGTLLGRMQELRGDPATWIDLPCPRCGNKTLALLALVTEEGVFNHSRYVCLLYGRGRRAPCGWEGWRVP